MDYNEFNYQLENLKMNLAKQLENSKLPLGAIFYLIKDIYNSLNNQYIASINSYSMSKPQEQTITQIDLNQNSINQESK